MYQKIAALVQVHGYTYKSFFLCMVVFPPAAAYVAWKKPGIGRTQRIVMGALGLFTAPGLVTATGYVAARVIHFYASR